MLISTKYTQGADRKEMLRFITNEPKKSLEVGCREGNHSKLLKHSFKTLNETWGIEPDSDLQLIQEAKNNLDYFINDYMTKESELPRKYFDLILFNDVLEHMYDPWDILLLSKELLTNDGILVISLPNVRHRSILFNLLFKDDFEYKDQGILDITHVRFFTETTMRKMLEDCGYEVLKIEKTADYSEKTIKKYKNIIRDILTPKRFRSLNVVQFGITAKVKK
ncbi:MAG: class I SAM-dependent methyltransferase [Arcobacteraceae bacterium]